MATKTVEMTFIKTPPGYSYVAPNTYEMPEGLAKQLDKKGFCKPADEVLPLDTPFREELYESGVDNMPDLLKVEDLTDIKVISAERAVVLGKFLSKFKESEKVRKKKQEADKEADSKKKESSSKK